VSSTLRELLTMSVNVTVTVDNRAIQALAQPGGVVYQMFDRMGQRLRDAAIREITAMNAVDSGAMRSSMTHEIRPSGNSITVTVGPEVTSPDGFDYPFTVHEGRGPVVPTRARVLRFTPKGSGVAIFRPAAGSAAPKRFMTEALARMSDADFY
jgi:hypothetical protein